jgi:hypothetical protein
VRYTIECFSRIKEKLQSGHYQSQPLASMAH